MAGNRAVRAPGVLARLEPGGAERMADEAGGVQLGGLVELPGVEALLHPLHQGACVRACSHRQISSRLMDRAMTSGASNRCAAPVMGPQYTVRRPGYAGARMSSQPPEPTPAKSPAAHGSDRELRADARRNRDRVLRTAQQLFATEGLGVSLDEIARRAGVGPGTVHRHFPTKEALYLAVATDQLGQLVAQAEALAAADDPAALFTLLSRMMANGAENVAVKSALAAAEFDLRTAAPDIAADLTRHVADLLDRAHAAAAVRPDLTVDEVMALVAGAFAAIRHAGAETSRERSAHIAQIIIDGLRPQPWQATHAPERRRDPRSD
jgi:AcrR family transcriptional regulator